MHIRTRVHTHAHVHTAYTITCTFKEQAILHSTTDRWRMNISSNMNYRNIFVVYDDLNGKEIHKRGDTYVYIAGFPWWLSRKESTCKTGGCGFYPWVGKIPWRKKWQPIPVFLPGKSHGQRNLGGLPSIGLQVSDTTWQLNHQAQLILSAVW